MTGLGQIVFDRAAVAADFQARCGAPPDFVVRAPGRVNLIGGHTDYNAGFVLPMAIDRATWIALRPRSDRTVHLASAEHGAGFEFDLDHVERGGMVWQEYPKGVAHALRQGGYPLRGWEGVSRGDVPMGAGLSSSASFELAVARAFAAVSGWKWESLAMARICQQAENKWVGVNCGLMDQLASALGQEGHALLIDCRDGNATPVPLSGEAAIVILDTATRRRLADSAYNERRRQCEQAAEILGVAALRNVTREDLDRAVRRLGSVLHRRARHVVSENERTLRAAQALQADDLEGMGQLMNASHESLRVNFEVSSSALDRMVAIARATPGCFGARMTGAGFGGCAVALVEGRQAETFAESVAGRYRNETSLEPQTYICRAASGAGLAEFPRQSSDGQP